VAGRRAHHALDADDASTGGPVRGLARELLDSDGLEELTESRRAGLEVGQGLLLRRRRELGGMLRVAGVVRVLVAGDRLAPPQELDPADRRVVADRDVMRDDADRPALDGDHIPPLPFVARPHERHDLGVHVLELHQRLFDSRIHRFPFS
jgi:hypothetical protein